MSTPSPGPSVGTPRPRRRPVLVLAGLAMVLLAACVTLAVGQQRTERIRNAEEKYSADYVGKTRDGRSYGLWELNDGVVVSCHISGDVADPMLACGEREQEPRTSAR